MSANRTLHCPTLSEICFRKSRPNGILSISRKTELGPKCFSSLSLIMPAIYELSSRRYEIKIFVICKPSQSLPPNGWRYPLVGGTRQCRFDGTNLKPQKLPENAPTPTTLAP